jgi:putative hydrolase of the HAD superfamily
VVAGIALFDLDNTLLDREAAFRRWTEGFVERHRLGPVDPGLRAWFEAADEDGYLPRRAFLGRVRDRFGLDASVEALHLDYDATYPHSYEADPAVLDGLTALADGGWAIGIVTNGPPSQYVKVDITGLAELADAVCISGVLGISKPDPAIFITAIERCRRRRARWAGQLTADAGFRSGQWMVGDSLASDIAGGCDAGLSTIWVDRGRPASDGVPPVQPERVVRHVVDAIEYLRGLA